MNKAVLALATLAFGCAASSWVVKKPVSEQCSSAGLQRCDDLTDAMLLYVDGNKAGADPKLREVAKANPPEKLQTFAKGLRAVSGALGAETEASVSGALNVLLEQPSSPSSSSGTPPAESARSDGEVSTSNPTSTVFRRDLASSHGTRTGMATPATDASSTPCESGPLAGDQARCRKVLTVRGPFVITNLYAGGGCPDELFALAGRADSPHWFVANQPNATLNLHGTFAVVSGEDLVIGVRAAGKDAPKPDPRCAIVWSGFKE